MKVINYEVSYAPNRLMSSWAFASLGKSCVTVEYQDEHGREQEPVKLFVDANDSDEDILRQCEEAIAPPVDNRTFVRKAKDAVDAFFDVCK